ncbi:MAG: HAD hydrolase-like protein [Arenimonas sp.]
MAALDLPDLIVFDFAGTTVHDRGQVTHAFAAALAGEGLTVTPERVATIRGASKRQAIEDLLPRGPDRARRADHVHEEFCARLAERLADEPFEEIAGVAEAFGWFARRSVRLALNTGFERAIALPALAALGWDVGVFAAIVCADEVSRGRPAPDMIQEAMMRADVVRPDRVANVGDTVLDLRAAHAARVRWNIGVLSGAHTRAQLELETHTQLLESVADLPTHVFAAAD